jgi:hypothetical protein
LQLKRFRFVLQFAFPAPARRPSLQSPNQGFRFAAAIVLVWMVALATAGLFAFSGAATAVQRTTAMAKNPLRLIVSRSPRYDVLYRDPEQETLTGWLDTLECGHQVDVYNVGLGAPSLGAEGGHKRHRCGECAAVQFAAKKPAQSVKRDSAHNQDLRLGQTA